MTNTASSKQRLLMGLLTALAVGSTVWAEPIEAPLDVEWVSHSQASGLVSNSGEYQAVVFTALVEVPGAPWMRLTFDEVQLSGSLAQGTEAYLLITSIEDGAYQYLAARHLIQWQNTSAYFNGDAVLVELIAHPDTGDNLVAIGDLQIGGGGEPRSICGNSDDRVLSDDPRAGRTAPGGCTAWLIDDPGRCFLTAGHCASSTNVMLFNVPLSSAGGGYNQPPPSDQYVVDSSSMQFTNGGVGNDWAYFGCFPNSNTGLKPHQAQGDFYVLADTPPAVSGQTIRITGYGTVSAPVSPTWNGAQKTHTGPYVAFTGTTLRYAVDTTGGNSGSAVLNDDTQLAIGIHTHAGCSSGGGANNGTAISHPGLQAALDNPLGVCAITDCNNNSINDEDDISGGTSLDCNTNGTPDECDIALGTSLDCNGTTTPDECETITGGDWNVDGNISLDDYAGFFDCMAGPGLRPTPTALECVATCADAFDDDLDGDMDLADIAAFQALLDGLPAPP